MNVKTWASLTSAPTEQLEKMAMVDAWRNEMQALTNYGYEWIDSLITRFENLVNPLVTPNWMFITQCMAQAKEMAQRGDTQSTISEWASKVTPEMTGNV